MGYLTKEAVLQAYQNLSHLSEDPSVQGATQKVSAIRHFFALDRFYKLYLKECNTRDASNKKEYADIVGEICSVCDDLYTTNFYYPLKKHSGDYSVGSNFYSAGQVAASLVNSAITVDYPKRGNIPLFRISNGILIRDTALYGNLYHYIESPKLMAAFVFWLLRDASISSDVNTYDSLQSAISSLFTQEMVNTIFHDEKGMVSAINEYDSTLNPDCCSITKEDIMGLFNVKSKTSNEITQSPCTISSSKLNYLTALRTKPFMLLAGISGTGKSRIVRKLAQATVTEALQRKYDKDYKGEDFANDRWKLHSPANFQLIQVKPNWHNSMDVVGYLSNIPSPHYVFTPFINFVVKAWLNPDVPFFLCLDEMNLAPVEEYFAEFLSAIESRSFENGEYMTDPIIKPFDEFGNGIGVSMIKELNDALKTPMNKEVEQHLRNRGLTLPKNLLVIGTVNMDETTFSFSRKVLDRAISIEMNEVDYGSFLSSSTDEDLHSIVSAFNRGEYKKPDGTPLTLNELLVERHIEADEVTSELGGAADGSVAKSAICYLETINHLLDGTPFKLGYRAANEALIYVRSAQEFGMADVASALDSFTLMKILSRIEGDESKLRLTDSVADSRKLTKCGIEPEEATKYGELTILTALREIIKDKLGEYQEDDRPNQPETEEEDQSTSTDREQRRSIQKIDQMISQLARDHFVSYWN